MNKTLKPFQGPIPNNNRSTIRMADLPWQIAYTMAADEARTKGDEAINISAAIAKALVHYAESTGLQVELPEAA